MGVLDDKQDNNVLSMDSLQTEDQIKDVLKRRTRPVVVYREINPKFNYTIEDVYQNELIFQKAQALSNLDREMVFIGEQIDKAMNKGEKDKNIYLKENDTRSYFDRYAIQEINVLLAKMQDHMLYVKVDYLNNGAIKLSAETYEKVMRDGVPQTKVRYVRPVELSKELLEGEGEKGYRLNVSKMRDDEESYHDKQVLKARKEQQKKEEKPQQEETEAKTELPKEEPKEEIKQPVEEPKVEEAQPSNTKAESVVNRLKKLEGNEQQDAADETAQMLAEVENTSDDDTDYASLIIDQLIKDLLTQGEEAYIEKPPVQEEVKQQEDYSKFFTLPNDQTQTVESQPKIQQPQPSPVAKPQLLMTEHDMKIQNFKRAADEVKTKIINAYGGDERRASQDPVFVSLQGFVSNTLEKQSQSENASDLVFDWNDANYSQVMQSDYQNKVQAFEKRYNEDTFKQVQERANNPF